MAVALTMCIVPACVLMAVALTTCIVPVCAE
jgi:hypothetical protein